MSNPGDRLRLHRGIVNDGSAEELTMRLEAIECPEVYRFKGHAGCRSCLGTGILWREVSDHLPDAGKKVDDA